GQASFNYYYPGPHNTPPAAAGTASLAGTVYVDINFNGAQDAGEGGVGGVTIQLTGIDLNGNSVSLMTVTDGDGAYSFTGLSAGTYTVHEVQPRGYVELSAAAGTVGGAASGSATALDTIGSITLGDG